MPNVRGLFNNLRPTTRDCVHLVTRVTSGHVTRWRSQHSIHANFHKFHVCMLYRTSYYRSKFYIAGIGIFYLFAPVSCDLDLHPMSFIYELDPCSLRYTGCANMNFLRQGFRKLLSDRQTERQTDRQSVRQTRPKLYITPLREWSKMLWQFMQATDLFGITKCQLATLCYNSK